MLRLLVSKIVHVTTYLGEIKEHKNISTFFLSGSFAHIDNFSVLLPIIICERSDQRKESYTSSS